MKEGEDRYDSVSSKWASTKRENKELKKAKDAISATVDRQKVLIKDAKQRFAEKEKAMDLRKESERRLEEKVRKTERKMVEMGNGYDLQIEALQEEEVRLGVQLKNAMQEMNEIKHDFDEMVQQNKELQESNTSLTEDVQKLKYFINATNEKSLQLIECINNSKHIMLGLSDSSSTPGDTGNGDDGGDADHADIHSEHSNYV